MVVPSMTLTRVMRATVTRLFDVQVFNEQDTYSNPDARHAITC